MPATGSRYPDDLLRRILGPSGFQNALTATPPLYDPTGKSRDYFFLPQKKGSGIEFNGSESKYGAIFEISFATAWLTTTYVLVLERNKDPNTTCGYTLVQFTNKQKLPPEKLLAGRDFTSSPALTTKALDFIENTVQSALGGRNFTPALARQTFIDALDNARVTPLTNVRPTEKNPPEQPVLANVFLGANPAPEQVRLSLFSGTKRLPPTLEEGGYAAGPLYDTNRSDRNLTPSHVVPILK